MNTLSSQSIAFSLLFLLAFSAMSGADASQEDHRSVYLAPEATAPLIVDVLANETDWQAAGWRELDQRWLGPQHWDDDSLEIFLDEDHSGGDHQFNHNAFAYHLSLDNRAIDIYSDAYVDGSENLADDSKERGWIDASLFGSLTLVD